MALQVEAGLLRELHLHQRRHQVRDGHTLAQQAQHQGQLQAEDAAPDYDGAALVAQIGLDHIDVVKSSQGKDTRQLKACQRRYDRSRTGGQHQLVVRQPLAISHHNLPLGAIDRRHAVTQQRRHSVGSIPLSGVEEQVGRIIILQLDHQLDAVIVAVRLIADDGDLIALGIAGQQLFNQLATGHAVACDYNSLSLLHAACSVFSDFVMVVR